MYKIFTKNLEGFKHLFAGDERISLIPTLELLSNVNFFNENKKNNTKEYQNLYAVYKKILKLRNTDKYHSFGMFLNELYLQYFDFEEPSATNLQDKPEIIDCKFDLLFQFMFPAYYVNQEKL
jgi:hypothetical protein